MVQLYMIPQKLGSTFNAIGTLSIKTLYYFGLKNQFLSFSHWFLEDA